MIALSSSVLLRNRFFFLFNGRVVKMRRIIPKHGIKFLLIGFVCQQNGERFKRRVPFSSCLTLRPLRCLCASFWLCSASSTDTSESFYTRSPVSARVSKSSSNTSPSISYQAHMSCLFSSFSGLGCLLDDRISTRF